MKIETVNDIDIVIGKEVMKEKSFPQLIFIRLNIHHKTNLIFYEI